MTKLGPLGDPLLERLLAGHAPGDPRPFTQRLDAVRTERDVDLLFRDLLAYYRANHPALFEAAAWAGRLADLDGDLLTNDRNGDPSDRESASERAAQSFAARHAPELTPEGIRRDLLEEKTLAFEETETYRAVAAADQRAGRPAEYARLPALALNSPKLTRPLSTAWFARAVDRRYQTCLASP